MNDSLLEQTDPLEYDGPNEAEIIEAIEGDLEAPAESEVIQEVESVIEEAVEPVVEQSAEPSVYTSENWQAQLEVMDRMVDELARTNMQLVGAVGTDVSYPAGGWPTYDSEVLTERLSKIRSIIPMQYNSKVDAFIKLYTVKKRDVSQRVMGLQHIYFPMIEEKLDARNMPLELKYLAVVESALNPHAVSPAGATGLWQIMYRTGLSLGLRTDSYVDERRDPERATEAALDYLAKLYNIYDDWLYAIAAYNCGPGNVNKAIRRSGGKVGIWEIWPYLPRETRGYVPAFVAVAYTLTYPEEHMLQAWQPMFEYEYIDTVAFTVNAPLSVVASQIGMTEEELYQYNPSLKRKYIPGASQTFLLKMPFNKVGTYIEQEASIYALAETQQAPPPVVTVASRSSSGKPAPAYANQPGMTALNYTVKSGDNLGFIAEWYDCGLSELRNWNGLYGNRIRAGQKLVVYKKDAQAARYSKVNSMSFAEKQSMIGKAVPQADQPTASAGTFIYTIKSGDNLWDISQKYPGNTVDGILSLNNISRNTKLQPGMKLKLAK